jgi:succinate dehydrogenase/fumarate reductase cytochrome b subunit
MEQNNNFQNGNFQNGNFQNGNFQNGNFQNGNIQNMNYQNGNIQGNTALNNDQQYAGQPYMANHSPMLNGQPMSTNMMAAEMEKQENVALGIIGAIGGSLIGVVVMVLLYYANTVAAIAGIAMIICAVKGYEKLSGRFSTRGVIISAIVTIAMVYVGARFCFAIELSEYYKGYNVFEAFVEAGEKIADNNIFADAFNEILLQQYLFAGIGIVLEVFAIFSNKNGKKGIGAFKKN